MRVVSLLPAATEILHALDAVALMVGRSHECDQPAGDSGAAHHLASLPALTAQRTDAHDPAEIDRQVARALADAQSLYTLDAETLHDLCPDLIVTQDLCEVCSVDLARVRQAAAAMDPPPEVLSLNPTTIDDVLDDIARVGGAIGRPDRARDAVVALTARLDAAAAAVPAFAEPPRVLFLEWTDPPFVPGHWTPQLLERAGAAHPLNPTTPAATATDTPGPLAAERVASKGFRVEPRTILEEDARHPFDRVIVCPCGMSLRQTAAEAKRAIAEPAHWLNELDAVRRDLDDQHTSIHNARVALVDGNLMFSRPGPRLVDAFEFLVAWLHGRPELTPPGFPATPLQREPGTPPSPATRSTAS